MNYDVAIVGAGVVGASTALWLQPDAESVVLLDRGRPGDGTSYGNACTIADYACIPINSPALIRRLPALLFSKSSPLRVDWSYALRHPGWQLAFLRNCQTRRVETISRHLGRLLTLTDAGLAPLIERSNAHKWFAERRGMIYIYTSERGFEGAKADTETRRRHGAEIIELSAAEFRALEPGIGMPVHRALSFHKTRVVRDPRELVQAYVDRFVMDGGHFLQSGVTRVDPGDETVTVSLDDGSRLTCRKLVVAAGAWSTSITGSGAEDLPLDTERGYHILFKGHGHLVRQPVAWAEGGFYMVPMAQGLRLAGTVELAGLNAAPNPDRIDYLCRGAKQMFGDIGEPDDTWLGFRPSFPDSLPVIGPSHRSDRIILAFGHQHIGLTLGGATGKLVADLIASRQPPVDLAPYSARRFVD